MDDQVFARGLKTYEPLPHRLQYIGEREGVKYYDDSISTICDTTIQALKTLKDTDTVLIGGMDRGIDYRELIEYLSDCQVPHIILMEARAKGYTRRYISIILNLRTGPDLYWRSIWKTVSSGRVR